MSSPEGALDLRGNINERWAVPHDVGRDAVSALGMRPTRCVLWPEKTVLKYLAVAAHDRKLENLVCPWVQPGCLNI